MVLVQGAVVEAGEAQAAEFKSSGYLCHGWDRN